MCCFVCFEWNISSFIDCVVFCYSMNLWVVWQFYWWNLCLMEANWWKQWTTFVWWKSGGNGGGTFLVGGWWNTGGGTLLEATGVNRVQDCACTHMHTRTHMHFLQFFAAHEQTQKHIYSLKSFQKHYLWSCLKPKSTFTFVLSLQTTAIRWGPPKKKKMEALAGLVIQSYFMSEHEMTVICG